ncbi:MAG: 30S ribosomal protein S12 methylthiotransferase RimO [Actinobacteria bacterium]|nr:30S ribosomal protein S12 methylthiotransferase RimO [Actinomycetota bacterium]
MARRYWMHTLGCPKNQVDSDKLEGTLIADGLRPATSPDKADLVVVNTCAFIEAARQESIDTILALGDVRKDGAELVVTGCMAERYGDELAEALPEVDAVVGFGVPVTLGASRPVAATVTGRQVVPAFDLLELARPASAVPWAYVKVAEGCDRACGFCAIPSFRGPQRSRSQASILQEVDALNVREVVLVAQDLAAYGRDQGRGDRAIVPLVQAVAARVERVRLLYLYPSDLTDELVEAIIATGVAYFDLSLQHVSRPLLARMRRWGDGGRFLERISAIRAIEPEAAFRSNFIVGYPGETEADHDALLAFIDEAQLDWCGFFSYSSEEGTYAAGLDGAVAEGLVVERLSELSERQDAITAARRDALIGREVEVLVDVAGVGRTYREAPEIDGIVHLPDDLAPGTLVDVVVSAAEGPDLTAVRRR